MNLRPNFSTVAMVTLLVASPLAAQQSQAVPVAVTPEQPETQADQTGAGRQTRPVSEAEEREREIRRHDPRAARGPVDGDSRIPAVPGDDLDAATPGNSPAQLNRDQQPPLPGSVAASGKKEQNPRLTGPKVAENAVPDSRDAYTGPAVLTRSYTLQSPQLAQQLNWRYSVGFNEIYDSGNNVLGNAASGRGRFGRQLTWSFSGRHLWRRDALSLAYNAAWNSYAAQNLRGFNQTLSANYSRVLARRLTFNLVSAGSILTQGYSLENPITSPTNSLADVNIAASPIVQLFDTTTRQVSVSPSVQWQKSARLSFNAGASWFAVERDGLGLIGQTGYQAQADVNYRLTKRMTAGAYYSATFYRYDHDVAVTDSHGTGLIFSSSFDRATQLRLRGGLSFFENEGIAVVKIDPAIAALLGTSFGIIDQYKSNIFTEMSAELARDLHHNRTATLSYSRGLAPGNGLILASLQQAVAAGFNMRLLRQYRLSTGVGWTTLKSGDQSAGKYDTEYIYMSFNRPVGRRAEGNLRFDYRKFTISTAAPTPNQLRVSLGIDWNSGEGPLRLW